MGSCCSSSSSSSTKQRLDIQDDNYFHTVGQREPPSSPSFTKDCMRTIAEPSSSHTTKDHDHDLAAAAEPSKKNLDKLSPTNSSSTTNVLPDGQEKLFITADTNMHTSRDEGNDDLHQDHHDADNNNNNNNNITRVTDNNKTNDTMTTTTTLVASSFPSGAPQLEENNNNNDNDHRDHRDHHPHHQMVDGNNNVDAAASISRNSLPLVLYKQALQSSTQIRSILRSNNSNNNSNNTNNNNSDSSNNTNSAKCNPIRSSEQVLVAASSVAEGVSSDDSSAVFLDANSDAVVRKKQHHHNHQFDTTILVVPPNTQGVSVCYVDDSDTEDNNNNNNDDKDITAVEANHHQPQQDIVHSTTMAVICSHEADDQKPFSHEFCKNNNNLNKDHHHHHVKDKVDVSETAAAAESASTRTVVALDSSSSTKSTDNSQSNSNNTVNTDEDPATPTNNSTSKRKSVHLLIPDRDGKLVKISPKSVPSPSDADETNVNQSSHRSHRRRRPARRRVGMNSAFAAAAANCCPSFMRSRDRNTFNSALVPQQRQDEQQRQRRQEGSEELQEKHRMMNFSRIAAPQRIKNQSRDTRSNTISTVVPETKMMIDSLDDADDDDDDDGWIIGANDDDENDRYETNSYVNDSILTASSKPSQLSSSPKQKCSLYFSLHQHKILSSSATVKNKKVLSNKTAGVMEPTIIGEILRDDDNVDAFSEDLPFVSSVSSFSPQTSDNSNDDVLHSMPDLRFVVLDKTSMEDVKHNKKYSVNVPNQ